LALKLRGIGITRIRPLSGGYAEWKRRGYPLQDATDGLDGRGGSALESIPSR
jgi:3-mercaptopyruvate sulfurtransferase SseA